MAEVENKSFLKRFLHGFLKLLLLIMLIFIFFAIGGEKIIKNKIHEYKSGSNRLNETSLPVPEGPKTTVYKWSYNGQQYEIEEILYDSFYNFYTSLPKTYSYIEGELSQNWEEEYFNMFLNYPTEEKTISELVDKIKELGTKNKLNDDQIVELALSFVQSIPYDEVKARAILAEGPINQDINIANAPIYPYELLYKMSGVCSDKSILAYALVRELGYGVAFFIFDKENHMSIGIKCPRNYANYNSGFCYAETTTLGNKIGIIPELDTSTNKAFSAKEIEFFDGDQDSSLNLKIISDAKILNISEGKTYTGIIQTKAVQQDIADLKIFLSEEKENLNSAKKGIAENENELMSLKKNMDKLLAKNDYKEYNNLVPKYNKIVENYQKNMKVYNKRVESYNQKVNEYNKLIKSFYQT